MAELNHPTFRVQHFHIRAFQVELIFGAKPSFGKMLNHFKTNWFRWNLKKSEPFYFVLWILQEKKTLNLTNLGSDILYYVPP